jgi:tripartite-type tricarboxylate transporter receptor subunit TctC
MRLLAALALVLLAGTAIAQESWPVRPIRLVVPYTPGTGADILARVLGPKLAERTKVASVVDNKPGATGNIGADAVAKSPADGYTLLLTATSFTTNPALTPAPFDPI